MSFIREVFSDGGQGSASRLMMGFHAVVGSAWVCHHLYHGHPLSDVPWTGLIGFVTSPYVINTAGAVGKVALGPKGGSGANTTT